MMKFTKAEKQRARMAALKRDADRWRELVAFMGNGDRCVDTWFIDINTRLRVIKRTAKPTIIELMEGK